MVWVPLSEVSTETLHDKAGASMTLAGNANGVYMGHLVLTLSGTLNNAWGICALEVDLDRVSRQTTVPRLPLEVPQSVYARAAVA